MKKLIIIILVFSSVVTARAGVLVTAKIDSMEIFIGEQVRLTVDVVARRNANVKFPDLLPVIISHQELRLWMFRAWTLRWPMMMV